MAKVKNYALIFFFATTVILIWQYQAMIGKRDKEKADKERWQGNYLEATKSMLHNKNLVLEQKEFLRMYKDSVKNLTDSLHITPRVITKYSIQYVTQSVKDTVFVPVERIASQTYNIKDSGPCFTWSGIASILTLDSLKVERTGFEYSNKITDLYYRKPKGKILFWRTYYKDKVDHISIPKCGTSTTTTIEIIK